MKKLLLLTTLITISLNLSSQVFWSAKPTSFSSLLFSNQISYADKTGQVVWVSGGTAAAADSTQKFSRSTDGGNTWVAGNIGLGNTALSISSIEAISATKAYVAANGTGGGIWVTNDSGATWTKQATASFSGTDSFADFVTFFSPLEGVAVGDPDGGYFEIYRTIDGGTNWTRVPSGSIATPLPPLTATSSIEAAYTRLFKRVGNSVWFGTSQGRIYRTRDKGITWQAYKSPISDWGTTASNGSFAFNDDGNRGIMIDNTIAQWSTTNGAETWVSVTPNGSNRDGALCFVPGTINTYVNTGVDSLVTTIGSSYSCDGGLNWDDINVLGDALNVTTSIDLEFANASQGLSTGSNTTTTRGIFKYVGAPIGSSGSFCGPLANNNFSTDKLFTVSPNPTNGLLKLTGENINQVQVSDLLGKVIFNNNYSSISNVDINLDSANSGVYMVKVTNNEGNTSTVKVVKQ